MLIGPAVRLSEYVSASDKRYQATIRMGASTTTYDSEGEQTSSPDAASVLASLSEEKFEDILQNYVGEFDQAPPAYSAVKVDGKKAYERAREGEEVELEPRKINVYSL
ncbi:MAG: hypothetical protein HC806_01400 [Anaerolineae bacterium]|nr:hypothetical protein [Anaerolineae bacterium]